MPLEQKDIIKVKKALVAKGFLPAEEASKKRANVWDKKSQDAYTYFLTTKNVPMRAARQPLLSLSGVHPSLFEKEEEPQSNPNEDDDKNTMTTNSENNTETVVDTEENDGTKTEEETENTEGKEGTKSKIGKLTDSVKGAFVKDK